MRSESITSLALAAGVISQGFLLWVHSELSLRESIEFWAAAAGVAIVTVELWRWRRYLNAHIDMLLIMFSMGGAAMAFSPPEGVSCHAADWTQWLRMSGAMIGAGLLPSAFFSRCLRKARREKRLYSTMVFDAAGMLAGMKLAGMIPMASSGTWAAIASHIVMVAGMMAGMTAAMALRRPDAYAGSAMTNVAAQVIPVPLSFLARLFKLRVWNPHT
jgi:hypothetical protein